jgi:Kdo2-lipid IVA lauroyltransferase/acyltransferase
MNRALESIICAMIFCFTRSFGSLPRKWGRGAGALLGRFSFRLIRRSRTIAIENLRNAYPAKSEGQVCAIARSVFEGLGKLLYELCWSTCLRNEELARHVKVQGMVNIRRAYEKGRGVLVLTAHFGNWELLPIVGKHMGYPFSIVYRPLDARPLEKFIVRTRTRFGGTLIPKKRSFRKVLKSLERKELVALLMDQNVARREGVFAPFFDRPACTNKGLALLALKTGAPVIPIFLLREEKGFTGLIFPEIPLVRTGDKTRDLEINTRAYNQVIESLVRRHPEQWFWIHRRWNTKPLPPASVWRQPAGNGALS